MVGAVYSARKEREMAKLENLAGTSLRSTISGQRDSASAIRKWLVVLSEMYSRELSTELVTIWMRVVDGIAPERVDAACKKLIKEFVPTSACPFPVPAHLMKFFDGEKTAIDFSAMEDAWQF